VVGYRSSTQSYLVAGILNVSASELENSLVGWAHQRKYFSSSETNVYYAGDQVEA